MELTQLKVLLSSDIQKLSTLVQAEKPSIDLTQVKNFEVKNHSVMSDALDKRPNKKVTRQAIGENGQPLYDPQTDKPIMVTEYKPITRIPLSLQKYIVSMRKNFLLGNPVEREANSESDAEKNLVEILTKTWDDNKLDYGLRDALTYMMSETEVAIICYTEDTDKFYWQGTPNEGKTRRMRTQILRSCGGDHLFPSFDQYGDMIAFTRLFAMKNNEGTEVENMHVYTSELNYFFEKAGNEWEQKATSTNPGNKIPVVYLSQNDVEWIDVQNVVDELESMQSNHGETNKYFSGPIAVFKGVVKGLPDRDDQGKAIELEGDDADARFMTWDHSTDSVKLEKDNLTEAIELFTGTPFITMERMAGLGTFSGIALKMLFALAHMKAAEKEAQFAPGVQRLINIFKAVLCEINTSLKPALNLPIKPKFTYFLPKNDTETLDNIIKAKNGGILSTETAAIQNPLVEDGQAEFDKLKDEKEVEEKKQAALQKNNPLAKVA